MLLGSQQYIVLVLRWLYCESQMGYLSVCRLLDVRCRGLCVLYVGTLRLRNSHIYPKLKRSHIQVKPVIQRLLTFNAQYLPSARGHDHSRKIYHRSARPYTAWDEYEGFQYDVILTMVHSFHGHIGVATIPFYVETGDDLEYRELEVS